MQVVKCSYPVFGLDKNIDKVMTWIKIACHVLFEWEFVQHYLYKYGVYRPTRNKNENYTISCLILSILQEHLPLTTFWDTSYSSDQVHHDGRCPLHNEFALVLRHYTCPEPLLSEGMFSIVFAQRWIVHRNASLQVKLRVKSKHDEYLETSLSSY